MEQHPVPQPITSYEFRLIGDMTLKQFGKLLAGVLPAVIVYALNPPSFIKWFLILFFLGIGAAMAFVPFEGRPVDVWIIAFFKRIYSPTQYLWKQKSKSSADLLEKSSLPVSKTGASIPTVSAPPKAVAAPLQTPPSPPLTRPTPPPLQTLRSEGKRVTVKFSTQVAIPAVPSLPNLIVGYIHTPESKIIEGAILEIRDSAGNPVRALKSNRLGQFQIATPLPNGDYEIETEKEGVSFDIIKISLKGEIIPPIEIVSK